MMIRYWQPFKELETLRSQMDRVFDELSSQTGDSSTNSWNPAVELIDAGDNLVFRALLPGISAQDVDVHVTRDAISLRGERKPLHNGNNVNSLHSEFRYGKFQRVLNLPFPVQNDKVQADYRDGILTLTLPKVEAVRNRVVKINLGELPSSGESKTINAGSTTA